jgi:Putative Actinobacterial Holin-X, holin superfamily III
MAEPATARPAEDGRSVGDLVSVAIKDLTQLIRYEVDLAKVELRGDMRRLGLSGALLATAVFTGFLVLVMLCFALAYGLQTVGIWDWASFLIVAGVCVLLAALAVLVVYLKVRRMSGLRKTRESVQEGIALLRRDDHQAEPLPPGTRVT